MKISTYAIAAGPALIVLVLKTAIEPTWLHDYSLPACIAIGAAMGFFGAIAGQIVEQRD